ncbi:MAG: dolichol-phosphate mannosyltransferase [Nitrospinaceae bacterium]|nr:MAG: dolichol-phosphate mannosyltransferase [Nitrospinaceae bacterium]
MISIIVPVFNEKENIPILYEQLAQVMEAENMPFEILFVNDGSVDESENVLNEIGGKDARCKIIHFSRNLGQTSALMAGVDYAKGEIIVPIDADLQNDPKDIPLLLQKLEEGCDVVSGWRKKRKDPSLRRILLSNLANKLISLVSGVRLNDYGCTLKAYRSSLIKPVRLYGEMHRFIPLYVSWQGGKVAEIPVNHHARIHGKSNYGFDRIFKVLLDLIVIQFLAKYNTKPIYVFGAFGIINLGVALLSFFYAVYLKLFFDVAFISTPLLLLVSLTFIMGTMSILMGLLAEMLVRIYYETQNKPSYLIKNTVNLDSAP